MRPENPTSFTAFASDMMSQPQEVVINDKKVSLFYDEKYFFDEALHIDLEDIETFAFREDCPILYLLDKKGTVHSYDIYRKSIQKNIFNVQLDNNINCIDMALSPTVLYVLDQNGLKAFSLITWQLLWKRDIADAHSMCISEKGDIYISTTDSKDLLKFNSGGEQIETLTIEGIETPVSVTAHKTADEKSKLYILDNTKVTIYDEKESKVVKISDQAKPLSSIAMNSKEDIHIGSSLADKDGTLWWGAKGKPIINQLSTYGQAIKKILFDAKDTLFVLDTHGFISLVTVQKVYKNSGEIAHIFDSTYEGCDWHKMEVDYEIPDQKGSVTVRVGAVDIKGQLPTTTTEFENKKDIYLHEVTGRYLVVKITLQSDPQGEDSPLFEKIKVHFPKETYLKYLPGIYQEDAQSKELMQRYLSVFQTIMEGIEEKIENSHLLIDPQTTPDSEFLNWLTLWLGLKREQNWSDAKWRELLSKAVYFFKRRGTREGLSELIALYTQIEDKKNKPIIIEPFQTRCDNSEQNLDLGKYTFCVIFKPKALKSEEELKTVKRIVKLWKPAHTEGKVVVLKERMLLGEHLCLGINTSLKEEPFILGEAALSIDTKLVDTEENVQVESHARLGIDTQINY